MGGWTRRSRRNLIPMRISSFLLSRCAFFLSALQQYLIESYHAIEGISNVFIYHLKLFSLKYLGPHIFFTPFCSMVLWKSRKFIGYLISINKHCSSRQLKTQYFFKTKKNSFKLTIMIFQTVLIMYDNNM